MTTLSSSPQRRVPAARAPGQSDSGNATVKSPRVSGKVHSIRYEKIDFADGVDFTVTADAAGDTIWAQSNVNAAATKYGPA